MRRLALPLAVLTVAAAAASAFAQPPLRRPALVPQPSPDAGMLAAQQELAARQAVIQQTELFRLDAQLRTQQNLATLRAMGETPQIPAPPATGPARSVDLSRLASIPDATLAASDARVRAAAGGRP